MLVVKKVSAAHDKLLDPTSSAWSAVKPLSLELKPTPIGNQPTPYTRTAWKDKKEINAVKQVEARLCHDGSKLYIRLEWKDPTENREPTDNNVFPDGAAVLFPIGKDAPINTMGNEQQWVNGWQWRADSEEGRSVWAKGVGTTEPTGEAVEAKAVHKGDRWLLVLARDLAGAGGGKSVRLAPGASSKFGVAVWEGSHGERAGYKGFTENWIEFQLAE
ncbi:MAG: hypothetical protein D6815_05225 [Candidatus Dadabacteria bacterium]|nr:MAG: hypothetical protein D6815_05225 [Candidatus Dadabacteria bacterium]